MVQGALNLQPLVGALGFFGQVEARNRALADARRQNRFSTLGTVAGAVAGGFLAAPTGGVSIPVGASLGASVGGVFGRSAAGGPAPSAGETLNIGLALASAQNQGAAADQQAAQVRAERGALTSFLDQTGAQQINPALAGSADDFGIGDSPEAVQGQRIQNIQGALSAGRSSPTPFATTRGALAIGSTLEAPVRKPIVVGPKQRLVDPVTLQTVGPEPTQATDPFFSGTAVTAQDSRNLNTIRGKILRGGFQSLTPAERGAYSISYDRATQPKIVRIGNREILQPGLRLDPSLFPVPPGLADRVVQAPPATGDPQVSAPARAAPEGAGLPPGFRVVGQKAIPFTDAAKFTSSKIARETFMAIRSKIVNSDGSINRGLLATMDTNLPFSEGRQVNQEFEDAISSRLRAESGAAIPDSEVKQMERRLVPNSLDSDAAVLSKLDRAQKFFDGVLSVFDIGRGILSESTLKALEKQGVRQGGETTGERRTRLNKQFNLSTVR